MPRLTVNGERYVCGWGGGGGHVLVRVGVGSAATADIGARILAASGFGPGHEGSGWTWTDHETLVGQICGPSGCTLWQAKTNGVTVSDVRQVAPRGANSGFAGGGEFAMWLGGFGVYTSWGLHLPDIGLADVSDAGDLVAVDDYHQAPPHVINVYTRAGGLVASHPVEGQIRGVQARDGVILYFDYVSLTLKAIGAPDPVDCDPIDSCPFATIGGRRWIVNYSGRLDALVCHPWDSTEGYVLSTLPDYFHTDARRAVREDGREILRIVMSATEDDITSRVLDLDVETGEAWQDGMTMPRFVRRSLTKPIVTPPADPDDPLKPPDGETPDPPFDLTPIVTELALLKSDLEAMRALVETGEQERAEQAKEIEALHVSVRGNTVRIDTLERSSFNTELKDKNWAGIPRRAETTRVAPKE